MKLAFFYIAGGSVRLLNAISHHRWTCASINAACVAVWILRLRFICLNEETA